VLPREDRRLRWRHAVWLHFSTANGDLARWDPAPAQDHRSEWGRVRGHRSDRAGGDHVAGAMKTSVLDALHDNVVFPDKRPALTKGITCHDRVNYGSPPLEPELCSLAIFSTRQELGAPGSYSIMSI
jgi:hypothetical protein